uniref:C2H2-type domain-containing protein n=1 Tax=Rhabditophanes sp. KR3021 TaxID=114890 RepID=A0AC35UHJ4_9BILA
MSPTPVPGVSEKAFICEICGKAFRFRSNLAEHRSVHSGNLTKHILKHHKLEQNAVIGTDEIIIKKGKKSVKDPAAIDFLEKSMIVRPKSIENNANCAENENKVDHLNNFIAVMQSRKRAHCSEDRGGSIDVEQEKFLMSLGLDVGSVNLTADSPTNSGLSNIDEKVDTSPMQDFMDNISLLTAGSSFNTPLNIEKMLEARFSNSSSPSRCTSYAASNNGNSNGTSYTNSSNTQCLVCGKHFRKQSSLITHMTVNHGAPPPSEHSHDANLEQSPSPSSSAEIKLNNKTISAAALALNTLLMSQNNAASSNTGESDSEKAAPSQSIQSELRSLKQIVNEINKTQSTITPKLEKMLLMLDARVVKVEKQLEMALGSIYTLVQLQTGISTNVSRFRDDTCEQLKSVKALLSEGSV